MENLQLEANHSIIFVYANVAFTLEFFPVNSQFIYIKVYPQFFQKFYSFKFWETLIFFFLCRGGTTEYKKERKRKSQQQLITMSYMHLLINKQVVLVQNLNPCESGVGLSYGIQRSQIEFPPDHQTLTWSSSWDSQITMLLVKCAVKVILLGHRMDPTVMIILFDLSLSF